MKALRQQNESNNLIHKAHSFPRHIARNCNPITRLVCYLSLRFIPSDRNNITNRTTFNNARSGGIPTMDSYPLLATDNITIALETKFSLADFEGS